jgi:flagellar motor switch protein FliN/FliY
METVLQTSVNPEITVTLGDISALDKEAFEEAFAEGMVLAKIAHKDIKLGEEAIVFSPKTAAKIADLMVMGDGSAQFKAGEHLDAVQEIVDQMFGTFSHADASAFDIDRHYALTKVSSGPPATLLDTSVPWVAVELILNIGEEHHYFHLLNPEAIANFTSKAKDMEKISAEADKNLSAKTGGKMTAEPTSAHFQSFATEAKAGNQGNRDIDMLMDLRLPITIELGRTAMFIKDILKLSPGSIIELNKLSGDPVDVYINEKKFAEGEVVVIDENFGVRITELVKPEDRLRKLS